MALAALREVLLATLLLACLHAAYTYHTGHRNPEPRDSHKNVWNKNMSPHRGFIQDKVQQHEYGVERGASWKLKRKKPPMRRMEATDIISKISKQWTPDDLGWSRKELYALMKIPGNRRSSISRLRWTIQGVRRDCSKFICTSSWSFGAGLSEFYGAGGSTGIARSRGDVTTLFNTLYPGFGQTGEWILQPQQEFFEDRKNSGPIDVNVLKSQLWASAILRDNMVTVFGYLINFPNNPLRTELYTSLVLLYDIIRFRRIQTVELVSVLQKMASATPRKQFLYLFKKMKSVVPKYMHSSVSVWIDALKRRDVDINSIVRPKGGPMVVDFLAGIDSSILDSLDREINFKSETIENASPSIADSMGRLLAYVFSALSDGSLILTQDLFALIMLHRPLNLMLPQREETERYLIDIFRLKNVENWGRIMKSVKREDFSDPIKLIRVILTIISKHKELDPLIQEDARYVLNYVDKPLVTFVNAAYNLASPVMSKPTIDVLELLKSIMPIEYPDEIIDLKTRIEYYILNGYLDVEFVIKGFNRFDHIRPSDLLIAVLTRIHRRLPKLPHEIISSVKYLKLYLIFKRFLCSMSPTVPTDLVDVSSFVLAFDGPKMPKRILNLVKKLAANLPYEDVVWKELVKETPIEECSRPRQCIRSIFIRVVKKGILKGRPSLNDMEEFLKLLDDQGNPLPEKGQLTDRNRGNEENNRYQGRSTHYLPSKSVTEFCQSYGFAMAETIVRPCEPSGTTAKNGPAEDSSSENSLSTNSNYNGTSTTESKSVSNLSHSNTPVSDEDTPALLAPSETDAEKAQALWTTSDKIIETTSEITTEWDTSDTETSSSEDTTLTEVPNKKKPGGKIKRVQNEERTTTESVTTPEEEVGNMPECSASQTSETTFGVMIDKTRATPSIEISSTGTSNTEISSDLFNYFDVSDDSTTSTPQLLTESDSSSEYFSFGTELDESSIPDSFPSCCTESISTEYPTLYSETLSVDTGLHTAESNTFSSLSETSDADTTSSTDESESELTDESTQSFEGGSSESSEETSTPSDINAYTADDLFSNLSYSSTSFSSSPNGSSSSVFIIGKNNKPHIPSIGTTFETLPTNIEHTRSQTPSYITYETDVISDANAQHTALVEPVVYDQIVSRSTDRSFPTDDTPAWTSENGMSVTTSDEGIGTSDETHLTTDIPFSSCNSTISLTPVSDASVQGEVPTEESTITAATSSYFPESPISNSAVPGSWYRPIFHHVHGSGGANNSSLVPESPGFNIFNHSQNVSMYVPTSDAEITAPARYNKSKTATSIQAFPVTADEWDSEDRTPAGMSIEALLESQHYKPELECNNSQHSCIEDVPISSIIYEGPKLKEINMTAIYPPDFLPPGYMFVQGRFIFIGQTAQHGLIQQEYVGDSFTKKTSLQMWKQYQQNNYNAYFGSPTSININVLNVQQNIINANVRLPIMNPLVQHEPASSAYPETLIPLTEPGSLQDIKLKPLRTFLSNPYLYRLLGASFKPESYPKKGPLLEAILTRALKVTEVHSDLILKTTIEQYLHQIKMENSKPDRPQVVVSFPSLVTALPYPRDENEAAAFGMVRAYLSQPDLHKTMNHLVDAVKYNTKGLMLKHVLDHSLNLTAVRGNMQLLNAINTVVKRVYMNGYGAQAVQWVLVENHKREMSVDVFSLFSTLDMRSLRQHPNGRDALRKVLYFVVHHFQPSVYLDGFDMTRYKTKATLLEGAFQFLLKQNAISPKLKESVRLLMSFIKFDGFGATPVTDELD